MGRRVKPIKDIDMVTRHEYVGLSTCGCTAFAQIGQPRRVRHRRKFAWQVLILAAGPCHPDGLEVIAVERFATERDAVASIESGWPEVVWVTDDGRGVGA